MRNFLVPSLLLILQLAALAAAQGSSNSTSPWKTLSGDAPLVIARGGFSGLFPDSSSAAYGVALSTSVPNVVLWCDVQLTKDNSGICSPDVNLQNSSDIAYVFKNKNKNYLINGVPTSGWFSVDFTLDDLANVVLTQGIYSRSNRFDGNVFQILTVQNVSQQLRPPGLWLNIQHDAFFRQHNLSMRSFVLSVSRIVIVDYISSPEVNFLGSIYARIKPSKTKLVFRFLTVEEIEPLTNQTYGSLLKNLTFVKTFASGILVPKSYIWPEDASQYLLPHTSVVLDAHKEGLEVFAANFVNDFPLSYNYSYDPVAEYLNYVDNGVFSVDGVLSDFPITPSEAIECFSHIGKNDSGQAKPLVISHNGAGGDYPGCTDLAYKSAISDGADVIDCPVQMTNDGIPFCLSSINLIDSTNVAQSSFSNLSTTIPEIQERSGIFTFSLTWNEIQGLTPEISSPFSQFLMYRNPKFKNAGNFLTLPDFLALAKNTTVPRVLIKIEVKCSLPCRDAQGLGVTDAVLDALSKAGYDNQTAKKVMIQSTNSSVLLKFKEKNNYELVYEVDENIRDALNSTVEEIKSFAHSVVMQLWKSTHMLWKLEIDGVITDFPKTAASYKKNRCLGLGTKTPPYMQPVLPGSLLQVIVNESLPPAEAPYPVLTESDVSEPPLPSVTKKAPTSESSGGVAAPTPTSRNGQPKIAACVFLSNLAIVATSLLLL
ncbi:hypothetical protein L1049_001008 [Liquidambar formosana]|uniref:glycerophosphodiester phosphodiesterase n=1 Tax=Liquidambar formosana TaxID=63359 RepID=A0AAP0N9T7_LIQFO